MRNFLFGIQIVISVLLIGVILLQQKGGGLGSTFGGESQIYHSKRGIEKALFWATVALAALFITGALVSIVLIS